MYEYIFVYIVLPLIIIIKIIYFLSETFFPYLFHVHLNILDKVVSSLYVIFGTPVYERGITQSCTGQLVRDYSVLRLVITENKNLCEEINAIKMDNTEINKPKLYASAVLINSPA
jgi:hypothetical protein